MIDGWQDEALAGSLVKIVWQDGHGTCLFMKLLECGRLIWSAVVDGGLTCDRQCGANGLCRLDAACNHSEL